MGGMVSGIFHPAPPASLYYSPFKKTISKFSSYILNYMHDISVPTKYLYQGNIFNAFYFFALIDLLVNFELIGYSMDGELDILFPGVFRS